MTQSDIFTSPQVSAKRLIALWALSEALLGGLLHAMRIPLTGFIIGGAAAALIILISRFRENNSTIIRATLTVIIIKMMMSPYTPVNAYFAVFIQGMLGYILLGSNTLFRFRAVIFGILVLTFSALQRIFVLTVIYGKTLWESIDIFIMILFEQFGIEVQNNGPISFSFLIISLYVFAHIIAGGLIGLWSSGLLNHIRSYVINFKENGSEIELKMVKKKKRSRWKKPGMIIIVLVSGFLYVYSLMNPALSEEIALKPIIMLVRAIIILTLWFYVLGPLLRKWIKKLLNKKKNEFSAEISDTIELMPYLKRLTIKCWEYSKDKSLLFRIWDFIHRLPANLLLGKTI